MNEELRRIAIAGIVLGVTAAAIAWWLERYNEQRMMENLHGELRQYLGRYDEFREWLRTQHRD